MEWVCGVGGVDGWKWVCGVGGVDAWGMSSLKDILTYSVHCITVSGGSSLHNNTSALITFTRHM